MSNISLITSNTTILGQYDTYLVDAAAQSLTITLPSIKTDGMNYLFNRIDGTDNSVGITGPDLIYSTTGSYPLNMGVFGVESYNGIWYPFIYNGNSLYQQTYSFALSAASIGITGFPAVMAATVSNPPATIGGLVPVGGTAGYFSLTCSPWYIPWDNAVIGDISLFIGSASVTPVSKTFPIFCRMNLVKMGLSSQTIIATIDIDINAPTGATSGSPSGFVQVSNTISQNFGISSRSTFSGSVTRGLYGVTFVPVNATNYVGAVRAFFGTINVVKT